MSHSDERIAALEAQLATLESRLSPADTRPAAAYDRRALLRRGGAVLAGAAGVMALPGMVTAASATTGTFQFGTTANNAGTATANAAVQTGLTSTDAVTNLATLALTGAGENNTNGTTTAAGTSYGQAQLNLVPAVPYTDNATSANSVSSGKLLGPFSTNPATTKTGDLFASTATTTGADAIASDLVYTHSGRFTPPGGGAPFDAVIGAVYTSAFHNVFVPIVDNNTGSGTPTPAARVIDTRANTSYTQVTPAATGSGSETPRNFSTTQSGVVRDMQVVRVKFTPGSSATTPGSFLTSGGALYAVAGNLTTDRSSNQGSGFVTALATAHTSDVNNPKTSTVNLSGPAGGINVNFAIVPVAAKLDSTGAVQYYFFDMFIRNSNAAIVFDVTGLFVSDTTDVVLSATAGYTASSASAKAKRARLNG